MRTSRPHSKFLLLAAAALAAAALIAALSLAGGSTSAVRGTAAAPAQDGHAGHDHATGDAAHTKPDFTRHLAVHTGGREPAPSAHAVHMRALLVAGGLPERAVTATVLTDEDCAPDARGVSHCRNELRLPSGRTITVRHPHRMANVPCMTPGERVRVDRGADA